MACMTSQYPSVFILIFSWNVLVHNCEVPHISDALSGYQEILSPACESVKEILQT